MAYKIEGATIVRCGRVADPAYVPIGDSLVIPERFYAVIVPDDPELPTCNVGCAIERGRAVCVDLRCERRDGGPPVSGTSLRELPLGLFVKEATRAMSRRLVPDGDEIRVVPVFGEQLPVEWHDDGTPVYDGNRSEVVAPGDQFDAQYARATGAPRRRGPLREVDLQEIASVYRAAFAARDAPTKAVAVRFGVARSTAGRWISEARTRGILGPTQPRVAGEINDAEEDA
jgi:hypothetical protein